MSGTLLQTCTRPFVPDGLIQLSHRHFSNRHFFHHITFRPRITFSFSRQDLLIWQRGKLVTFSITHLIIPVRTFLTTSFWSVLPAPPNWICALKQYSRRTWARRRRVRRKQGRAWPPRRTDWSMTIVWRGLDSTAGVCASKADGDDTGRRIDNGAALLLPTGDNRDGVSKVWISMKMFKLKKRPRIRNPFCLYLFSIP